MSKIVLNLTLMPLKTIPKKYTWFSLAKITADVSKVYKVYMGEKRENVNQPT